MCGFLPKVDQRKNYMMNCKQAAAALGFWLQMRPREWFTRMLAACTHMQPVVIRKEYREGGLYFCRKAPGLLGLHIQLDTYRLGRDWEPNLAK